MKKYSGIGASPGLARGPVLRLEYPEKKFGIGPFELVQEQQRLAQALQTARRELQEIMDSLPEEERAIVEFQWMLLEDDGLMNEVRTGIREGLCAAEAVDRAGQIYAQRLLAMTDNPYMQLRGVDILDVAGRVVQILCGMPRRLAVPEQPVILAAERLMPTDLFRLPANAIQGVITAADSDESHAAILARAMAIPAVVQVGTSFLEECSGRIVQMDGRSGECILDPEETAAATAVVPELVMV